jgi:NADH:ubiquinone oxidoreductase subunit E
MTGEWLTRVARRAAPAAAIVMGLCVLLLTVDWMVAAVQAPKHDKLVAGLQKKVKSDASLAPRLAAEQKRITAGRIWRKRRDHVTGYVLLAAAIVFLASSKRVLAGRPRPVKAPEKPAPPAAAQAARAHRTPSAATPPALDLAFVDEAVARIGRGKEAAIPLLQAIQEHYRYLPDAALARVCELTEITPSQIAGASTFYGQFRRSPVGKHIVKVCHGTACHVAGARQVTDELRRSLGIGEGEDTDPARLFTIEEVACLGCCSLAPVLMVDGQTAGRLTPATAPAALDVAGEKEPA